MKKLAISSLLLLTACNMGAPGQISFGKGLNEPAIVYRPANDPGNDYKLNISGEVCGAFRQGHYIEARGPKLAVREWGGDLGNGSAKLNSGEYVRISKSPASSYFLDKFEITKVPADQAKKELSGLIAGCV